MTQTIREKRERLKRLVEEKKARSSRRTIISRDDGSGRDPLSCNQESLWFLNRLEGPNPAYNITVAISFQGSLDVQALTRCLREIITRHDSLRQRFLEEDGAPYAEVIRQADLDLTIEAGDSRLLAEAYRAEANYLFDLTNERLFRVRLLRLSGERHALLVNMYHIVGDGWSTGVFMRELVALYRAVSAGEESPLAPLPLRYGDYSRWQREWLRSSDYREQLGYWKRQLDQMPQVLNLPTDRPRPAAQSNRGDTERALFLSRLRAELNDLGRRRGCTLFQILTAGFEVLLHRHAGQEDFGVGTVVANRKDRDLEQLIGFFVNTLVLRCKVSGGVPFSSFLERTREVVVEASAHGDMPFDLLVEELQPERDVAYSPMFQVMIVLQNMPYELKASLPGVEMSATILESGSATYDLSASIELRGSDLEVSFEYRSDLFDRTTIKRWLGHYERLLEQVAADPERSISSYDFLTEGEKFQALTEWNDTADDFGHERRLYDELEPAGTKERFIHQFVERQAREHPARPALRYGGRVMTYQALNERANLLAHLLISHGIGPESRVAICVERSLEMVVGVLGILKAGGAYVPIDPGDPSARIGYLLADSGVRIVATQTGLSDKLPLADRRAICLDDEAVFADLRALASRNPRPESLGLTPDNLAYVIYTSGSTGLPKGACLTHESALNLLWALRKKYGVVGDDRILQFASISFDVSVSDLLMALPNGASLYLLSEAERAEPERLQRVLRGSGITHADLPTAFLGTVDATTLAGLRCLNASGEALDRRVAERLLDAPGAPRLFNAYGPTETTVTATMAGVSREGLPSVPIGAPFPNFRCYVLGDGPAPVSAGTRGELCIGGAGLARGYLSRPALTAERFPCDPFSQRPGQRLYRTGDVARRLRDGRLDFVGRVDNQVKLRGFRVELGEVEARLSRHDEVAEAVVMCRQKLDGESYLAAYAIPTEPAAQPAAWIERAREYLGIHLPSYMIPSVFMLEESFPLTASGKVDRRSLRDPEASDLQRTAYAAPRSDAERILCDIWQDLLELDRVGIDDNFFRLGGHSLLATRLISRIRQDLGTEIPVRRVFEHPTVRALAAAVGEFGGTPVLAPVRAVDRGADLPASYSQQRLWFIDRMKGGSHEYNMPAAFELEGLLDVAALRRAVAAVVARHEVLRTHFRDADGELFLHVRESLTAPFTEIDLGRLEPDDRRRESEALARADAHRPFDLETDALLRVLLVGHSARRRMLLLNVHHIASDGWSTGVLFRELGALYGAFADGRPSPLPPLELQYTDYASWQKEWLRGEVLSEYLEYWKQRLVGMPRVHSLPLDRPRPPRQSFAGMMFIRGLGARLSRQVEAFCEAAGVTPFMFLHTAFVALVGRFSREADVVTGSPITGRTHPEVEPLIGFFVNNLILRSDLGGNPRFATLLANNKETILEAYAHQHLPFDVLVEELNPERSLQYSPVFQLMFALENDAQGDFSLPGLTATLVRRRFDISKFDLTLTISEGGSDWMAAWEVNTDIFDPTSIERMADSFEVLLRAIVAAPETGIENLALLPDADREQILVEWNASDLAYPSSRFVHQVIEEQAPDNVALVFEGRTMTYRTFNERANQVAHHLIARGVRPGSRVGLCVERSFDMMVGVLAILKAGGAYVPLDPGYPRARLEYMLEDSRVEVVLTQGRLLERMPFGASRAVCLDDDSVFGERPREASGNPSPDALGLRAEHLAYVIYTSGSTGKPKGVCLTHRSALNLLWALREKFAVTDRDRILQFSTISFDVSTWDWLMALPNGAALVLLSETEREDKGRLESILRRDEITYVTFPPAVLGLLDPAALSGLEILITAGEALDRQMAQRVLQAAPDTRLFNAYGPTEATVIAAMDEVSSEDLASVPIGPPFPNFDCYVLNDVLEPVPVGVLGELYLGGVGLAQGYLDRPALTAEKFLVDPFSPRPGERIYRTGDVARWTADGRVDFVGRVDHQIKIRGFRVELGEIETRLSQHGEVGEAVVLCREKPNDEPFLVAYVIPNVVALKRDLVERYREHLETYLPDYMIPAVFMLVESLPLTASGKVDRQALPEPGESDLEHETYVAPRTGVERDLCGLWEELLSVEQVGIDDNFFTLGGHSLLATRLISRIRKGLGAELRVRDIFESPTVRQLAAALGERRETALLASLRRVERTGDLPASYAQQRLWFIDQLEGGGSVEYNMPIASFRIDGPLDAAALRRALARLTDRHEVLRTHFKEADGSIFLRIREALPTPFIVVDLERLSPEAQAREAEELALTDAHRPFDLDADAFMRLLLVRHSAREHTLHFTTHHVAFDGGSMGVLFRELTALYGASAEGRESPLPPLEVQYADYASWQREWLQGEALEQDLGYWQRRLASIPPVHSLPLDRPRPPQQRFTGTSFLEPIHDELSREIRAFCKQEGVTLFIFLQTAFATLVSRVSGEADVVMGTPTDGRRHREVEALIGVFVNNLVLRTDLTGDPSFRSLLRQNRETVLEAYTHQHLPFDLLVDELKPERSLRHSPIFQLMFTLENKVGIDFSLPAVTVTEVPRPFNISKYEISLGMFETEASLAAGWGYNTDIFCTTTMRRMARCFDVLLGSIVTVPDERICNLALLREVERRQLLVEWNDTAFDQPRSLLIHQHVERQALRHPENVALVHAGREMSYRRFNEQANRVAHRLIALGVAPETRVGLCVERSFEMMVGVLGILKAGGAYVPLDPRYPKARIEYMLADCGVEIVLTQSRLLAEMPFGGRRAICLDDEATFAELRHAAPRNPSPEALGLLPEHLAYIIYTSGSTGLPKGVCLTHANARNFLWALRETYGVGSDDRVLQFASISFDVSTSDWLTALPNGASLFLLSQAEREDREQLQDVLRRCEITHAHLSPAYLSVLDVAPLTGLECLTTGGEALDRRLARRVLEALPGTRLFNAYGPTEITVNATIDEVSAEAMESVPIGAPLPGYQCAMLSESLEPVPIGVGGELYVGGAGIARGYLNRPTLTAERFVCDPFSEDPGARLYRTGDVARWTADGRVDFVGRVDKQVKIRGFRVELGEIEAQLLRHDEVGEAVVLFREKADGEKYLAAYVIPRTAPGRQGERAGRVLERDRVERYREHLEASLPNYMIPSVFILEEAFPLTATGKVDRKALRDPEGRDLRRETYAAPRTDTERKMCRIWQDVLKVEQVGIDNNFFRLGGHSILATRLVSRVRQELAAELPVRLVFERPTVRELAVALDELRHEAVLAPIRAVERTRDMPASYAQQRLWFIDKLVGGSAEYNIPMAFELEGRLDLAALRAAFGRLVDRHEVLRSHFREVDGDVYLEIREALEVPVVEVDLERLGREAQHRETEALALADAHLPFDLDRDALLRVLLVKHSAREHMLLLNMHHIASDGASMGVMLRELNALYTAFVERRSVPAQELLPVLPVQYADYATWQREWLRGDVLDRHLTYWTRRLAGIPPLHSLPLDRARPSRQSFAGSSFIQFLDAELALKVRAFSEQSAVTPFMLLHTAFATLLGRYSAETDVVTGSPIAGRMHREVEPLIGFFVNNLVLRTDLGGDPSFRSLLERSKATTLEAFAHQHLPFDVLVDELKTERSLRYNPVFQLAFALQSDDRVELSLPGVTATEVLRSFNVSKFDVALILTETESGLVAGWQYNTDVFCSTTIHRMAACFGVLLESVLEAPDERLGNVPVLGPTERQMLLAEWNDTREGYPRGLSIHQLFESQAKTRPEDTALVFGDRRMTYRELDERANRLAHRLRELGTGPETLVGLFVERSAEMVVGVLGILKADGAYVPLDPDYPQARLDVMLRDAGLEIVLTLAALRDRLPAAIAAVLCLDDQAIGLDRYPATNPASHRGALPASHLAYLIYTSGSTGRPKGVEITHENVVTLVSGSRYLGRGARVAQASTISFDAATIELWGPLCTGGRLVGVDREVLLDAERLKQLLAGEEISMIFVTTSLFNKLAFEQPDCFSSVEFVLFGGEQASTKAIDRVLDDGGQRHLIHCYGPTETTTFATLTELAGRFDEGRRNVSIGGPMPNMTAYVLSGQGAPVPAGGVGELYLGGTGVCRGYFRRPGLTAERFVPDPFSPRPGALLYRTGDRVRNLRHGELEFLGRVDHQVKLRGFRIEPGEIETHLSRLPGVEESVVMMRETAEGEKVLVAYLVADDAGRIPAYRERLKDELPEYMVPTAFVVLDAFPVNRNGKVDRDALPAPRESDLERETYVAPRDRLERDLCEIWQDVLGIERVGVDDNFFVLGGHSLLATRLVSRIRRELATELPLRLVFERPTVRQLAPALAELRGAVALAPIRPVERDGHLPASYAQQRLWFIDRLEGSSAEYNIPMALELEGRLDVAALRAAFAHLVERHEVLRTHFWQGGGKIFLHVRDKLSAPFTEVDLEHLPRQSQGRVTRALAMADAYRPFDLDKDAMLRVLLVRRSAREHTLLVNMHHVASDGGSLPVLVRELNALYTAFATGGERPLPPLEVQYTDYASWQRQWLQGEVLDKLLGYWTKHLAGIPQVHSLPLDRARPPQQSFGGDSFRQQLDAELSRGIKALCERAEVTPFMFLHTAFAVLLGRYSAETDVVTGSPIAGRTHREVEPLIGFFVNNVVLRCDLGGNPSFRSLLERNKETILQGFAHQHLPFDLLVDELKTERSLKHSPVFQVTFALQNDEQVDFSLPELTVTPVPQSFKVAKFDLLLLMTEAESGLSAWWQFNTDIFCSTTIRRMAACFGVLLEGLVEAPDERIGNLAMLSAAERQVLLAEWVDTRASTPQGLAIHHLFEEQAQARPREIAVVYGDRRMTYRELNEASNRLAHHLRELGTRRGSLVGLFVERSVDMVVGLLGILKAGGAYVPLDSEYPQARLDYMLRDAGLQTVLTQTAVRHRLPADILSVVCLDDAATSLDRYPTTDPDRDDLEASDLAYVMFTSGSTGRPKGVEITHENVVTLVSGSHFVGRESRVAQASTVSFDAATIELWGPLCTGGRMVHVDRETLLDAGRLEELLVAEEISMMWVTTSLFNKLAFEKPDCFSSVEFVLTGGEQGSTNAINRVLDRGGQRHLINGYGPTETTTFATLAELTGRYVEGVRNIQIGAPMPNMTTYVLNDRGGSVPLGGVGEVHIGGTGVGRGYFNRPELTAERFVPDPFSPRPGRVAYRTGDRVRWSRDGEIEFLGRADSQIKLRGFRIELGEIEAQVSRLEGVQESVVVMRETEEQGKFLVAYLVTEGRAPARAYREQLRDELPDYMIPTAFVMLESLPVNENGKVDRDALPEPLERDLEKEDYVAPRSEAERDLCRIWQEVLGVERVGIDDNFFALGGHSLLATRLIIRIRKRLGTELRVRVIFERPTVRQLAAVLDERREVATLAPLVRVARDRDLPASYSQQRLWFIDRLEGGSTEYNMPLAFRLEGPLDVTALRGAVARLVERHEVLRTHFRQVDGQIFLCIHETLSAPFLEVDVEHLARPARRRAIEALARADAHRRFDLDADALLRILLVRHSSRRHTLLLNMHHIASDGWSVAVLVRELNALYTAFVEGRRDPLPRLEIQYTDYASWQRDWLRGEVLEQHLEYWKKNLAGIPPVHSLPLDRARPPRQSFAGRSHGQRLSAELSLKITAFCQAAEVTPFIFLHTAFVTLLSRYSAETDVVTGTPITGRTHREVEPLIGFFVNNLVLRCDLGGGPSFRALLEANKETILEGYAHQHLPFDLLVDELNPVRTLQYSPVFQLMFALQNDEKVELSLPYLTADGVRRPFNVSKFDILLAVTETESGLVAGWEYNTDIFLPTSIERMASCFAVLLESILDAPEERVTHLALLAEAERRQLLVIWNDSRLDYSEALFVHQHVERQARDNPENVALVFEGRTLTYRQLNEASNLVAHELIFRGVTPESRVGLCVERSLEMMIGVLGILKAGGAYLPLDPGYPRARIEYMLEDSRVEVVLTQRRLLAELPAGARRMVCLDDEAAFAAVGDLASRNPSPESVGLRPESLAYVIYTSGSTGDPKGVCVAHRSALNLLWALREKFAISSRDRVLQFSTITFDVSTWDWLMALPNGARLVLPSEAERADRERLEGLLRSCEVTHVTLPPAYLGVLDASALAGLETLITAGEALDRHLAHRVLRACPGTRLYNAYGPTEATVIAAMDEVSTEDLLGVPIGPPFPNFGCYVLDEHLEPVPAGVLGELYLSGVGLARGYLDRPGLTAERFLCNPFSEDSTDRLYRTGDIARWTADGRVDFVGRVDHQVKIRGFRVELGEIEAQLARHDEVADAIVLCRERADGEKVLAAYVIPPTPPRGASDETPAAIRELERQRVERYREHLKARLPDYMIPSVFLLEDAFPLTPSGKVDRKSLRDPQGRDLHRKAYVAPRDDAERRLCAIWQEVLKLEKVGIDDNFFEVGGHSLLATHLISRIRQELGSEVSVRAIFERPTVRQLVVAIEEHRGEAVLAPIRVVERTGELPASYAQQRLWFIDRLEGGSAEYNMPLALGIEGALDVAALRGAAGALIERHEVLRTHFFEAGGEVFLRIRRTLPAPVVEVDLSHLEPEARRCEAAALALTDAHRPFDLDRDALLRLLVVKRSALRYTLLLNMHHIASDGASMGVLMREVGALYAAGVEGRDNPLPPLEVQYADYAFWQRTWLRGEVLDQHLGYWKRRLAGLPPVHSLPLDRPRPPQQSFKGRSFFQRFDRGLQPAIRKLCERAGITPFMFLHTAFATLVSRFSGERDVVTGTPIAGRTHREVEPLIGFFVNNLVLRCDLGGNPPFLSLLERHRERTIEAYAHQHLPFDLLVDELKPARTLQYSPVFQLMFALRNDERVDPSFPGVTVSEEQRPFHTSKFDLTLTMIQAGPELAAGWEYNTDIFCSKSIERMASCLAVLLGSIVDAPEMPVENLALLPEAERRQLLVIWNDSRLDYPEALFVHQHVEGQARDHPDNVALVFEGRTMTYRQLNERANLVAHELISRGVTPESRVGLCVERSLEMMIGVLGILKAGGAYLPLDPGYPRARIEYMLGDSRVEIVLTQRRLLAELPAGARRMVCLDDEAAFAAVRDLASRNPSPESVGLRPESLAYVIYTSGSTGEPKGVCLAHRSALNLLWALREKLAVSSRDRILQFSNITFDVSTWDWLMALPNGARLVLPSEAERADRERLQDLLRSCDVTHVTLPPAYLGVLDASALAGLETLITAGEALDRQLAHRVLRACPGTRLYNAYGPTEATVIAAMDEVSSEDLRSVPIGPPFPNFGCYVLDEHLEPVPAGVLGELYLSGVGLARGYLDRPGLTAERFLCNPFSEDSTDRLYRTGDVARWTADGRVDFVGRVDHQVKIRGFRVELGEIEAQLSRHPEVADAVALCRDKQDGEKYLVAYVIAKAGRPAEGDAAVDSRQLERERVGRLREHLEDRLPHYMIPAVFLLEDAFPLTPSGKVDRRALRDPEGSDLRRAAYVAPESDNERAVCAVWQDVLQVERVGVDDNFFEIGGHSLSMIRVCSGLQERGSSVAIVDLFRHQTPRALAAFLERQGGVVPVRRRELTPLVRLNDSESLKHVFCVHPGGGTVGCYLEIAARLQDLGAFYGLQAPDIFAGRQSTSLPDLAAHYVETLKEVQANGPWHLLGWSLGGVLAYEMACQLTESGEEVAYLGVFDAIAPDETVRAAMAGTRWFGMVRFLYGEQLDIDWEALASRSQEQGLRLLEASIVEQGVALDGVPRNLVRRYLRYLVNVQGARTRYAARRSAIDVELFRASEALTARSGDAGVPPEGAGHGVLLDEDYRWGGLTSGTVSVVPVAGNHFTMFEAPHLDDLSERLRKRLEERLLMTSAVGAST